MNAKRYYSQRKGNIKPLKLEELRVAFRSVYESFRKRHYFIEFFGKDSLSSDGIIGNSFEAFCMRNVNRSIKPPSLALFYSEDDLFDVIELFYENINYPLICSSKDDENIPSWLQEDTITSTPEKKEIAQKEFQDEINVFLRQYSNGWELSDKGYIRNTLDEGFRELVDNTTIYGDDNNIDSKIRRAKELFLKRGSTLEDKKTAIREIGDAFEFIRKDVKERIGKSESDIFLILNNFGIRHNNLSQKTGYDQEIYFPWMFYTFLSAYDAYVKMRSKNNVL